MKTRFNFHALLRFDAHTLALIEAAREAGYDRGYMDGGKDGYELAECEADRARRRG